MDSKLVSGSLSTQEDGERESSPSSLTYTEQFHKIFPYYLSIGMTYEQFWEGEVWLVKDYREAEKIRFDRKNQEMWIQGMYIYEALCDVSPILRAFAKKGTKPVPFINKPYQLLSKKEENNMSQIDEEKKKYDDNKKRVEAFMFATNARFKNKKT